MIDQHALSCPCSCHGRGHLATCDLDGGCGHLHRPPPTWPTAEPAPAVAPPPNPPATTAPSAPVERAGAAELVALHERRCARAEACPGRTTAHASDGTRHRVGRLLDQPTGLCEACVRTTAEAIRALPADFLRLYAELRPGSTAPSDKVGGTREAPVPFRIPPRDLAQRIATVATTWAETVASAAGIRFDTRTLGTELTDGTVLHRRVPAHRAVAGAARLLNLHLHRLLTLPEQHVLTWSPDGEDHAWCLQSGLDAALELAHLHHTTDIALGLDELQHHLPAPCPRCERMTLVRDNGASTVRCTRGCVSWPESDYTRLTLVLADDLADGQPARRAS